MKSPFASSDVHAYLDGELSSLETQLFEKELAKNPELAAELNQLRANKQKIVNFYRQVTPPPPTFLEKRVPVMRGQKTSLVASLLLGVIIGLGGFMFIEQLNARNNIEQIAQVPSHNFVVHLDSKDPVKMQKTLLETQYLLSSHPAAEVEIVANYQGIQLFDARSESSEDIKKMLSQYNNLRLVACQNALERAKTEGREIQLMQGVKSDTAAIDEVVDKMKQGWAYIKI